MSEKIKHYGPDGTVVGVEVHVTPARPSKNSSRRHPLPTASDGPLRLSVRCRAYQLIGVYGVYGDDPPTLLGTFAGVPTLRLQGVEVVAPRPDLNLAWLRAGRDPADFAELVVADSSTPLQLGCPIHNGGHYVDPALLRAEVAEADVSGARKPRCAIGRVEVQTAG